jgi:chromosome segregation and condensation protein ScpB
MRPRKRWRDIMAELTSQVAAPSPRPATAARAQEHDAAVSISIDDACKDREVLLQLVESCLFMRGEAIIEGDIADTLGIPLDAIHQALLDLVDRYASYGGAIRVREIDVGTWLMDLHPDVAEHVDTFYIDQKLCTRSEVMSLAFIAFMQPVPKHVLAFYRGTNAGSHARKWIDAGFMQEEIVKSGDSRLAAIVAKYRQDVEISRADALPVLEKMANGQKQAKSPVAWLASGEYSCYATTSRFSGYFNLPHDLESMKKELENWKEIYGLFD